MTYQKNIVGTKTPSGVTYLAIAMPELPDGAPPPSRVEEMVARSAGAQDRIERVQVGVNVAKDGEHVEGGNGLPEAQRRR